MIILGPEYYKYNGLADSHRERTAIMEIELLKIRARRRDLCAGADRINLFVTQKIQGEVWQARPLEFIAVPDSRCLEPIIDLDATVAQQLMDDLWECGLRPSEGTGSAGAFAAVQNHLRDMRRIAFSGLGIEEPEKGK